MLCKRPTRKIEDSVKEMGGAEFFIEEKLDGERIQLHKRGNEYFYCSRSATISSPITEIPEIEYRKGKDYTYLYGSTVGVGSLTPFIDGAFDSRVDKWVIACNCPWPSSPFEPASSSTAKCWSGILFLNATFRLEHSKLQR